MITTQINGITLTENAIEVIHRIQDCEHDWMKRSLEEAIDTLLVIDTCNITDKERLNLIMGLVPLGNTLMPLPIPITRKEISYDP